ncbi:MAG: endopeptidase La [Chitinophagales bacterium]|nr:endopeptidase La [Chitinophagales bacterium]
MNFEENFLAIDDDAEFLPIVNDSEIDENEHIEIKDALPVLALRNSVIFPGVIMPISVGRDTSIKAVRAAYRKDKLIAVMAQTDAKEEEPGFDVLYNVGTLARIIKMLKMPDGTNTVILQGVYKIKLESPVSEEPYLTAMFSKIEEKKPKITKEFKALTGMVEDLAKEVIEKSNHIPSEAAIVLKNIKNRIFLINFIASNLNTGVVEKQQLLEIDSTELRANKVLEHLNNEIQMLDLRNKIQDKTRVDIEKQQRDYFLHQQLKHIQEELGQESPAKELESLRERAAKMKWPKKVAETFDKEYKKLHRTNPAAPEYALTINHLELLLDLPWDITTKDNLDLKKAKKVLDDEHYGLDKIKDRILEYLAVIKLKGDLKSPILCFVGPPGVGKTSLGKSIANALGRKYVRMSLGGLHDESEIRGHRKTYIGAMPGRIIQSLKKVKSSNPVFILDEIDKVGKDFRGDPSSALLEVLDPEQNSNFYDNYLESEFDLSKVMFIATANNLGSIQPALRDRMEIIQLSGYPVEEKVEIAKKHLIPQQREAHGLKAKDIKLNKAIIEDVISKYTRESGVRNLERTIASLMRAVAKRITMEEEYNVSVSEEDLETYLGPSYLDKEKDLDKNPAGVALGLAYTAVGGDILFIETTKFKGKESFQLTGNIGNVMKESSNTALTYLKAHAEELGIKPEDFKEQAIHLHFPAGATPKDGPSAGITILTALASLFTGKKVKPYLAMTGEISLRGKVLPVGGIKEKVLAAKRAGVKEIIMCADNEKSVKEINEDYIKGIQFHYVENMMDVLKLALV